MMSDVKEYIKGDKHVHQAGSVMTKFAQYNVPGQQGDWKRQEAQEAEELEKEFADFEEVADETAEDNNAPKVKVKPDLPPADVFGRNRQTLWGDGVRMLTQNCCQTIHEERDVSDSFYLCPEAFDF